MYVFNNLSYLRILPTPSQAFLAGLPGWKTVLSNVDKVSCSRTQHLVLSGVKPANLILNTTLYHCTTVLQNMLNEWQTVQSPDQIASLEAV